jgi:topoisomerase-4 subunit A
VAGLDALMRRHFIDYASYAILDRAIPDLRDGLKPVQRRLLHTLFEMHDGRYHKVANVIGETMKLHPHGDASIGDALVVLANKGLFIDRQGNFGNVLTGHPAAAARYIECRLTPLALDTLFDETLTESVPSYDGRTHEPVFLPARMPVILMLGAEGIAVGMATRILPHNAVELWEAQIALLEGRDFQLLPDFAQGGIADVSEYDDGRGKVVIRARVEPGRDGRRLVIRELPYGTTTESLIASIEAAIQRERVQVASIQDYTTDHVEIELSLARGARADEVIGQLYAHTDCQAQVFSNIVVIHERRPREMSVSEVLRAQTELLRERLHAQLGRQRGELLDRKHWLTLERIFVEHKVYRQLERATSEEAVRQRVRNGMEEHEALFVRPLADDDVTRLLELRIRRISAFDLERSRGEESEIEERLAEVAARLADLTGTAVAWLRGLVERYGDAFPRRTEIAAFEAVDKKAVSLPTLRLAYDRGSGFLGSAVRGEDGTWQVSEYDLLLAISDDGSFRVMPPPEKQLIPGKLLWCDVFDSERGAEFTVVYRDRKRNAFGKRVRIERFIRGKEYELIRDKAGRIDLLLPGAATGTLSLRFAPAPRQRVAETTFDLAKLERTGVTARGMRLAPKPIAHVKLLRDGAKTARGTQASRAAQASLFGRAEDPPSPRSPTHALSFTALSRRHESLVSGGARGGARDSPATLAADRLLLLRPAPASRSARTRWRAKRECHSGSHQERDPSLEPDRDRHQRHRPRAPGSRREPRVRGAARTWSFEPCHGDRAHRDLRGRQRDHAALRELRRGGSRSRNRLVRRCGRPGCARHTGRALPLAAAAPRRLAPARARPDSRGIREALRRPARSAGSGRDPLAAGR